MISDERAALNYLRRELLNRFDACDFLSWPEPLLRAVFGAFDLWLEQVPRTPTPAERPTLRLVDTGTPS